MRKRISFVRLSLKKLGEEVFDFGDFLGYYLKKKVLFVSRHFEKNKNRLVKFFLMKRGRYNRPFLHFATMGVLSIGVLIAPYLSDTYPVFSAQTPVLTASAKTSSITVGENVFKTAVSSKVRDKIITYTVEKGDTISSIARKFDISIDTIKWANNLTSDSVSVGDTLKILPVTGIAHKVQKGDTVYSIAKLYSTDAQKIVDFPFNDFANPETFTLVEGQILIVPDGVKPSEKANYVRPQVYIAQRQSPVPVESGGFTFPISGAIITQYFSWYHSGVDLAAPYGTPVYAAHNGTVTRVSVGTWDTGYGNNVWISKGDGIESHYAHLRAVNVSVGQYVTGGVTVIGWEGSTGRSTGPHLHFEIRKNGVYVNPLSVVQ